MQMPVMPQDHPTPCIHFSNDPVTPRMSDVPGKRWVLKPKRRAGGYLAASLFQENRSEFGQEPFALRFGSNIATQKLDQRPIRKNFLEPLVAKALQAGGGQPVTSQSELAGAPMIVEI
jgi:hypothetical protein